MISSLILAEVAGDRGLGEGKGLVPEKEDKGGGRWVRDCVELVRTPRLCRGGEHLLRLLPFNLMTRGSFLTAVEFPCVWRETLGLTGLFPTSD